MIPCLPLRLYFLFLNRSEQRKKSVFSAIAAIHSSQLDIGTYEAGQNVTDIGFDNQAFDKSSLHSETLREIHLIDRQLSIKLDDLMYIDQVPCKMLSHKVPLFCLLISCPTLDMWKLNEGQIWKLKDTSRFLIYKKSCTYVKSFSSILYCSNSENWS